MEAVNSPPHYKRGANPLLIAVREALLEDGQMTDLECINAMLSMFSSVSEIRGYLRGNSFKYRWRYQDKGGLQDLRKARWYERKLELLEETILAFEDKAVGSVA